jgi:lipopolysaccharide/colanic/teichoic acid biosynthesis glycosyltransferase
MKSLESGILYCRGWCKRWFDLCVASIALALALPIMALVAAVIAGGMGRPILFEQERIGIDGRSFRLIKFRTMRKRRDGGLPITGAGDGRVTAIGRVLRASKLDELPQLVNVLKGEMSIVGPRPEVPRYVAKYDEEQRLVLRVRPGLTDIATLAFRDEERLMGAVEEEHREEYYLESVLPQKLKLSLDYLRHAGLMMDLLLILKTILAVPRLLRS